MWFFYGAVMDYRLSFNLMKVKTDLGTHCGVMTDNDIPASKPIRD